MKITGLICSSIVALTFALAPGAQAAGKAAKPPAKTEKAAAAPADKAAPPADKAAPPADKVAAKPADKVAAKPADKAAAKPAAGEVTLKGSIVCAKCVLKEAKACQDVLKVTEGKTEVKYYIEENAVAKEGHVCSGAKNATVTGTVSEKEGKHHLVASAIKLE